MPVPKKSKKKELARRLVFVFIAIIAVMAILVALPNLNTEPPPDLTIEYSRHRLASTDAGLLTQSAELLSIRGDGSATHTQVGAHERQLTISDEELRRMRALILETGFMQIPTTNYPQSENATDFTRYTLRVHSTTEQKTFNWVNPEAHDGTIPPIITNIGSQLDSIIDGS